MLWSCSLLAENPNLLFAILRSKDSFQALRNFTLETGQQEIERQIQSGKETSIDGDSVTTPTRENSLDGSYSTVSGRTGSLSNVQEESNTFAIGDDVDSDEDGSRTPAASEPLFATTPRTTAASSVDDAVPLQLKGMSEKARGKMPAGQPEFSRQNSGSSLHAMSSSRASLAGSFTPTAEWVSWSFGRGVSVTKPSKIETWLSELPLHTILTLISQLSTQLPRITASSDVSTTIAAIRGAEVRGIEPSPIRVHLFDWSPLSLGWYESLLWGFIFTGEMLVSKGTAGIWSATNIKLFRVQGTAARTPSLFAPRGAVDAVGSNLVQRIGNINLRGGSGSPAQRSPVNTGTGGMTVRDV